LLDRPECLPACPKLAESYRLDPGTGALLASALCYERAGKTASAWDAYSETADRAKREGNLEREKAARAKMGELEAKLSKLIVRFAAGAEARSVEVTRDGVVLSASLQGVALPIDPGEHVVEARGPGRAVPNHGHRSHRS
jgi:hypothetical protein